MEELTFCVLSHCVNINHLMILKRSLDSIRLFYPNNRVIVIKTSQTGESELENERVLMRELRNYKNVEYHNTILDGSHIYGGMYMMSKILDDEGSYIFMHDSSVLVRELPSEILERGFYPIFNFIGYKEEHEDNFKELLKYSNLTENERENVLYIYKSKNINYIFGPMFGGRNKVLKEIVEKLGINKDEFIKRSIGRMNLMCAERYLACSTYVINPEYNKYVLSGNIFEQENKFNGTKSLLSLSEILKITKDKRAYFYKTWFWRD